MSTANDVFVNPRDLGALSQVLDVTTCIKETIIHSKRPKFFHTEITVGVA